MDIIDFIDWYFGDQNTDFDINIDQDSEYLDFIPENYLLEMQGMGDAIDSVPLSINGIDYLITIDFLDILVQNTFWDS